MSDTTTNKNIIDSAADVAKELVPGTMDDAIIDKANNAAQSYANNIDEDSISAQLDKAAATIPGSLDDTVIGKLKSFIPNIISLFKK